METKDLKKYAPQARRDFIEAVTNKAAVYGLLPDETLPMQEEGDVVIIGERAFPRTVAKQRKELETRIRKEGFQQFIEAVAYTWFNRFVAIRYMELHGYLDHGYRVLSHPAGKTTPEIMDHAERVELPGLDQDAVIDLKLDGGKDEELYQTLLIAQCNALHSAMPFLFESVRDGAELLLPDNLLHTDSLVRTLVGDIPEDQWENVEIIGWLYQFYISEKKDEVMGKVVKSEDIPAATQLFTPNWIVKYLVQNTLGRQWMATYPDSPLKQQMEFYIEPAEQTTEVQQQLDEITPESLNPEELTLLDPACGSGHILVEAYDLFRAIYTERGYRSRDIPKLILTKNLYGLEIDDRAAQLAAFAMMMKARHDDRRIFDADVKPHIVSLRDSTDLSVDSLSESLDSKVMDDVIPRKSLFKEIDEADAPLFVQHRTASIDKTSTDVLKRLIHLFESASTVGSLQRVPSELHNRLGKLNEHLSEIHQEGNLFERASVESLRRVSLQAELLGSQFDVVVTNPPYMGSKMLAPEVKKFGKKHYADGKADLFGMFMIRVFELAKPNGFVGLMTPFVWMFLQTYRHLRSRLLESHGLSSLIHPEYHAFFDSAFVPICAFTASNAAVKRRATFIDLGAFYGAEKQSIKTLEAIRDPSCDWRHEKSTADFLLLPGTPIAYSMSNTVRDLFKRCPPISETADARQGLATTNNDRFVRFWWELPISHVSFDSSDKASARSTGKRWFPFNKGGPFRKWYGNMECVVNWEHDGEEIKQEIIRKYPYLDGNPDYVAKNQSYYFRSAVTWSDVTCNAPSFRLVDEGSIPGNVGHCAFFDDMTTLFGVLGLLNTPLVARFAKLLSPALHFDVGYFKRIPFKEPDWQKAGELAQSAIQIARDDWNESETSWDYRTHSLMSNPVITISQGWDEWVARCEDRRVTLRGIECESNQLHIDNYGLTDEMSSDVPEDEITLRQAEQADDIKSFLNHALGCMMGRYSLDESGLVYANIGNEEFDPLKYATFSADEDGIIPVTGSAWFSDDAATRFEDFVKSVWSEKYLEENLDFVAESLGRKKSESSRDCIRRYMATGFYKNHLSMYKKRPIYWLFSSGKQKAFQCLVYLHRYNAGTLSRMRTEYVVKLQGKINARIDQLENDIPAASSTSHRKKLEKEQSTLIKQRDELQTFDEKLRHYADLRIELDLDDGVKVNYGKFGDLLAEVKAITGKKPEVLS